MLAVAGGIGLSWNGLSFVAAAEIAGTRASGAGIGLQQTLLGVAGIVAPIGFATLVAAATWRIAFLVAALFPLAGWAVIHPLVAPKPTSRSRSSDLVDACGLVTEAE